MTYSWCVVYIICVSTYQCAVVGFVTVSLVFPHTIDLFSGLVSVSFVLLVFPHTGDLLYSLAGVLFVFLVFPHTGNLFSVCCFFVRVSMYQWTMFWSCKYVACVSTCNGLVLRPFRCVIFILLVFPSTIGHCRRVCVYYVVYSIYSIAFRFYQMWATIDHI